MRDCGSLSSFFRIENHYTSTSIIIIVYLPPSIFHFIDPRWLFVFSISIFHRRSLFLLCLFQLHPRVLLDIQLHPPLPLRTQETIAKSNTYTEQYVFFNFFIINDTRDTHHQKPFFKDRTDDEE